MPTSKETEEELRELRLERDIGRRRNAIIRRLARRGVPLGRLATATGRSLRRIEEIVDG